MRRRVRIDEFDFEPITGTVHQPPRTYGGRSKLRSAMSSRSALHCHCSRSGSVSYSGNVPFDTTRWFIWYMPVYSEARPGAQGAAWL